VNVAAPVTLNFSASLPCVDKVLKNITLVIYQHMIPLCESFAGTTATTVPTETHLINLGHPSLHFDTAADFWSFEDISSPIVQGLPSLIGLSCLSYTITKLGKTKL